MLHHVHFHGGEVVVAVAVAVEHQQAVEQPAGKMQIAMGIHILASMPQYST